MSSATQIISHGFHTHQNVLAINLQHRNLDIPGNEADKRMRFCTISNL